MDQGGGEAAAWRFGHGFGSAAGGGRVRAGFCARAGVAAARIKPYRPPG
jgi:hypothetical protein